MTRIGIIQGRLSPPDGDRIQSFPVRSWKKEFNLADQAGLDCIEWIYEKETELKNPLRTDQGIHNIRARIRKTSVTVESICADYYMTQHLITDKGKPRQRSVYHLRWLLGRAQLLDIRYIILPFVDSSSLRTQEQIQGLIALLHSLVEAVEQGLTELHLETDLPADTVVRILNDLQSNRILANYDIGNSAALGYDPVHDLKILKPWIGSVHVKDRLYHGGTVLLGTGAADFPTCFNMIRQSVFKGPYIIQAARDPTIPEVELAIRNRQYVLEHLSASSS